jgi:hypothetical protein
MGINNSQIAVEILIKFRRLSVPNTTNDHFLC